MSKPITYAKALGPPDDWEKLRIVLADGGELNDVIEANAEEGWLIRFKHDEAGKIVFEGDEVATERVERAFTIERRP